MPAVTNRQTTVVVYALDHMTTHMSSWGRCQTFCPENVAARYSGTENIATDFHVHENLAARYSGIEYVATRLSVPEYLAARFLVPEYIAKNTPSEIGISGCKHCVLRYIPR